MFEMWFSFFFCLLVSTFLSYSEFSTACLPLTEYQYCFLEYRCFFQSVFFWRKKKNLVWQFVCFFVLPVLFHISVFAFITVLHVTTADCLVTVSPGQWRIQKILVGGDLKHKTSKIRMSSPKLRVIFWPKSDIQTFFSPKFRWSPKKKRSSPKLRVIFRPKSDIQTFFSPKFRWSPKKKRSSPELRLIFRRIRYV